MSIEIVTTDGKLAQYYLGVEYSPKDMLLGLIDASGNKIGSPVANILTYCYHYDPQTKTMRKRASGMMVQVASSSVEPSICVATGLRSLR